MKKKCLNCPSRVFVLRDCLEKIRDELLTEPQQHEKLLALIALALALAPDYQDDDISVRAFFWSDARNS